MTPMRRKIAEHMVASKRISAHVSTWFEIDMTRIASIRADRTGRAKAVNDLADRARKKQLKPEEVQGGTFTITNPGIFGSLMGTPIINQPQVAILGVGTIEKRPVVIDDAIAIRTMAYFSIS